VKSIKAKKLEPAFSQECEFADLAKFSMNHDSVPDGAGELLLFAEPHAEEYYPSLLL